MRKTLVMFAVARFANQVERFRSGVCHNLVHHAVIEHQCFTLTRHGSVATLTCYERTGLSMNFKAAIRKAWVDPVWSKVIGGAILAALGGAATLIYQIGQWLMTISWGDTVTPVIEGLAWILNISVPFWSLIFLLVGIALSRLIFKRVTQWASRSSLVFTSSTTVSTHTRSDIRAKRAEPVASLGRFVTDGKVQASTLQKPTGTIAAWALVTDEHNKIGGVKFHRYIISSAGNEGSKLGNPAYPMYPNAWAISRITPFGRSPNGEWRFFCNGIDKSGSTTISTSDPLSPGWKLFSVGWSKPDGVIRFYIDGKLIGERPFLHWPEHSVGLMSVGTWQKDHANHQFNSQIGSIVLLDDMITSSQLEKLLEDRPAH